MAGMSSDQSRHEEIMFFFVKMFHLSQKPHYAGLEWRLTRGYLAEDF